MPSTASAPAATAARAGAVSGAGPTAATGAVAGSSGTVGDGSSGTAGCYVGRPGARWCAPTLDAYGPVQQDPARRRRPQAQDRWSRSRRSSAAFERRDAGPHPTTSSARSRPRSGRARPGRATTDARADLLDDLLPEAFAAVREAGVRTLGQRHFDVQIMGGAALHFGWVAEMKTGEGKTLVATLPLYLNALAGGGVHLVTVNDYLAKFDAEWMVAPLRVPRASRPASSSRRSTTSRRSAAAYAADITYGTNNEFGFDYLRDNMAITLDGQVQRGHAFAIVDEVDSILIDEARTPLIISGRADDAQELYVQFAAMVKNLQRDRDYEVDEAKRTVVPTEEGIGVSRRRSASTTSTSTSTRTSCTSSRPRCAPRSCSRRDVDYVVQGGEVKIVDEFTGRILEGRRWSEGLHQAVEAKERVKIKEENQTLATITLQNYFRMYDKLAGMTGTAIHRGRRVRAHLRARGGGDPHQPADGPRRRARPHLQERDGQVRGRGRRHRRAPRRRPAGARRHDLGREVGAALAAAREARASRTRCSNAKQHEREAHVVAQAGPLGGGHRRHQHGRPRRRHPPRRQPRGPRPAGAPRQRHHGRGVAGEVRRSCSSSSRRSARPTAPRCASSVVSTCSAPSATRAAASTTSCAAARVARATPARAGSTCRSKTTSCACSRPAR